jgi:serine/threonine protein kinase
LTDDDRVKITDFGIAKFKGRVGSVQTDAIFGTPSHMSPEQVTGGEVDDRSDMFALGIILYTMLTGEQPFKGDTATVMFKIVHEDATSPSHLNPELAPAHDHIALRCLAKDRNKRYSSAREFLDDLENVQRGRPRRSETKLSLSELRTFGATIVAKVPPIGALLNRNVKHQTKKRALAAVGLVLFVLFAWRVAGDYHGNSSSAPPAAPIRASAPSGPASLMTAGTFQLSLVSNFPSGPSPLRPAGLATPSRHEKTELGATTSLASAAKTASADSELPPRTSPVSAPAVPKKTPAARVVHLVCKHELQQAVLTVSSGPKVLFNASLKGKKKAAFLGLKGGYAGVLSRPLSIPADVQELCVRLVSADGSVDLTNTIAATSAAGPSATLYVAVDGPNLALNWGMIQRRAPSPPSWK